ncbi:MAG TPA: hypothetical protein VKU39_11450 [Streptosporangiaceae bacterium]|nr:hypothetical protein [Streptosporangiaceae bacterium]
MNAKFPRRRDGLARAAAPDDMLPARDVQDDVPGRACCCPARPLFRIVMPGSAARPHRTDLLLCGHHYRASRAALAMVTAAVYELPA